jgi:hypothetical protein
MEPAEPTEPPLPGMKKTNLNGEDKSVGFDDGIQLTVTAFVAFGEPPERQAARTNARSNLSDLNYGSLS